MANSKEEFYNQYYRVVPKDGGLVLVDREGNQVPGVRHISVESSYNEITTATVKLIVKADNG